ncbi:hypothetical protein [Planctomicrobium piriforme]|uniref:Uncharacterized protein n=1 Tax=Planctomicrobium piriforme TaxID=1576369 RepID=A0A1I3G415_9PLAN|nr:hypothetical protein [Planctomicrobium piriforme]SFI18002.1 hypothetical protein SAMN05421753_106161 [Planctomicrobium piriforme]
MRLKVLARELACATAQRQSNLIPAEQARTVFEEFLRTAGYLVGLWRRELLGVPSGRSPRRSIDSFEEITFVWMFVRIMAATWASRAVRAGAMREVTPVLAQLRRDACAVHQVLEWLEHQATLLERVQMSRFRRQVAAWTDSLLASSPEYPMTLDFSLDPERCREFAFDHNLNLEGIHAHGADALRRASLTALAGEKKVTHPLRGAVCRRLQQLCCELRGFDEAANVGNTQSPAEGCLRLPEADERGESATAHVPRRSDRKATA